MNLTSLETLKQTLCQTPFFLQHQLSLQVQNSHIEIKGLGSYRQPQAGQLIFLKKFSLSQSLEEYETVFRTAKAFLLHEKFHRALFAEKNNFPKALLAKGYLFSNQPEWLFYLLLSHFDPYKAYRPAYPLPAIIDAKARAELATKGIMLDRKVRVGPFVSLGRGCRIGAGASLLGHNSLGENCSLGDGVTLHPGVTLYANTELGARTTVHSGTVIGADGFGYEMIKGELLKIPQIGRVVVEEEVEIGANVTIDRATVGETRIGKGVKVDNLVQIAHNVEIGAGALIVSQVGIGGSSQLEKGVVLAGQVGIADHCVLGAGAQLGAQSGLMPGKRVPPGAVWFGSPALPARQRLKMELALQRLGRARSPQ